jgi:hypothetical protein
MDPEDLRVLEHVAPDLKQRWQLEQALAQAEERRQRALSFALPMLLLFLVLEVVLTEVAFSYISAGASAGGTASPLLSLILGYYWELGLGRFFDVISLSAFRIIPFWLLTVGIVWPLYYFRFRAPLNKARNKLRDFEAQERRERLSTREGRLDYLQKKLRDLSHETARVFLDNEERYEQAKEWREQVEDILEHGEQANLGEAESLVNSIYELKHLEEREVRQQRNWRLLATVIIIVYIAALFVVCFVYGGDTSAKLPVFGVPLSVAMWAAAGSLAAILYRFYTEQERVRLDLEVRWLIARPIIGIIMGMVTYVAITAGLLLLDVKEADPLAVGWVIAFIAGFSDKFYIRIINLLVERTVGDGGQAPSEAEQAETAEPEPAPTEPEPQDAEEQPDQSSDLDAGEDDNA